MNTITSFVKRNPLVAFFALAIGISWGSYYILSGPFLFPFGSILAALIVASLTGGKNALKDLLGCRMGMSLETCGRVSAGTGVPRRA